MSWFKSLGIIILFTFLTMLFGCKDNEEIHQHHYSEEWVIDQEATCINAGYKSHHCLDINCDSKKDITIIEAKGHLSGETQIENEVKASCISKGNYESVIYCQSCGFELSRTLIELDFAEHIPNQVVCGEVQKCSVCNIILSEALEHEVVKVIENDKASTCLVSGTYDEIEYCKNCNIELSRKSVIKPLGEHKSKEAASCTEDEVCYVCGEVMAQAFGHQSSNDSCISKVNCEVCGELFGGNGHNPGAVATCITPQTCQDCGEILAVVDENNHVFSEEWSYDDEKHWHQPTCGHNVIDEQNHIFTDTIINGIKETSCECGYSYQIEVCELIVEYKYANGEEVFPSDTYYYSIGETYCVYPIHDINFMVPNEYIIQGTINDNHTVTFIYDYSNEVVEEVSRGQSFDAFMVDEEKGLSFSFVMSGATNDWAETIVGQTFALYAGTAEIRDSKTPSEYVGDWHEKKWYSNTNYDSYLTMGYAWYSLASDSTDEILVTWSIDATGIKCYKNGNLMLFWSSNITPCESWSANGGTGANINKTIADLVQNIYTEVRESGFELGTILKLKPESLHNINFKNLRVGYAVDDATAKKLADRPYHLVTINYLSNENIPIAKPTSVVGLSGESYEIEIPTIAGFTTAETTITGTFYSQDSVSIIYYPNGTSKIDNPVGYNMMGMYGWDTTLREQWYDLHTFTDDFEAVLHYTLFGGINVFDTLLSVLWDARSNDDVMLRLDWCGFLNDRDKNGINTMGTYADFGDMFVDQFEKGEFNLLIEYCDVVTTYRKVGTTITIRSVLTANANYSIKGFTYVLEQTIYNTTAKDITLSIAAENAYVMLNSFYYTD